MEYRVSDSRGVILPTGRAVGPGTPIDPGMFRPDALERLVAAGFVVRGDRRAEPAVREGRSVRVTPSKWTVDPADVEGWSLDQLNVRIKEIDERVEPFETVEEAVAWLSQDFEG